MAKILEETKKEKSELEVLLEKNAYAEGGITPNERLRAHILISN